MNALTVSLVIPAYNDETTIRAVVEEGLRVFEGYAESYEVIVVVDGSPDRSGEIADRLAEEHPGVVRVVHHDRNRGYGATLRAGASASRHEWICMVDGDNEYAVSDLRKMLDMRDFYRLIVAFRYKKLYSSSRIFISFVYNQLLRLLFRTPFRDVSTGIRAFHRSILEEIELTSNSPFVGAELAIKAMLRGFPVGQVGIQTFPRSFGRGTSTTVANIRSTIRDMLRVRREMFSDSYHLPPDRVRGIGRSDG